MVNLLEWVIKMRKKWITAAILGVLFIILTLLVMFNYTKSFDSTLYSIITFKMVGWLTSFYKVITFLGSTVFIVSLCILFLVLFIIIKKPKYGCIITVCLIISTIFNNLVKFIVRRPRPEVLKLVIEKSFSYPSGHTMAAVSMYGMLIYLVYKSNILKKYKIMLYIFLGLLPILIALSRIYLGAHFASDVTGAFLLSTSLLLIEISIIESKKML